MIDRGTNASVAAHRLHCVALMPETAAASDVGESDTAVPECIDDAPTARMLPFASRFAAGCLLGKPLAHHARSGAVVLGLPHGGLAVADGVARELGLPFDAWCLRELRAPTVPYPVIGIVSEGASLALDRHAAAFAGLSAEEILALADQMIPEVTADGRRYRGDRRRMDLRGKTAIIVEDAIVSSTRVRAAAIGARRQGAVSVVIATPLGCQPAISELRRDADDIVCLAMPSRLRRAAAWYRNGRQPSHGELRERLEPI